MSADPGGLRLVEVGGERELAVPASGQVIVGSDPVRASLLLTGAGVAARHCRIGSLVGGGYALRDLDSAEGTLVNGERVNSKRIVHGDRLQLGSVELTVLDLALEPVSESAPESLPERDELPALDELVLPGAASPDEQLPRSLGGYRIVRTLGRGAFGHVLLAVQESLQRETALKLLSPNLEGNADFVRRFQEEARAAASLSHPNVVIVYDVGEADGHHFLSMEYMAQGSLEQRLRREGRLPSADVVAIMKDAARGLVYAEQRGIVHRDIKPANLMVSAAGVTKISDLGLAVSLDAATRAAALGTAHFVSPEQARGEPIDHRSDLYSLGATAFRLLTGRTPFEGRSKREILQAVFHEPAPLASDLAPETPPALADLIARLLAKTPAERPESARLVVAELEHLSMRAAPLPAQAAPKRTLLKLVASVVVLAAVALGTKWFLETPIERVSEAESRASAPEVVPAPPEFDDVATPFGKSERPGQPKSEATGASEGAAPVADDRALELLERQAGDALAAVDSRTDEDARRAALETVVESYRGTDAAVQAETELAELVARRAGADALASQLETERATALLALRTELRIDTEDFQVVDALEHWSQYQTPMALLGDRVFADALTALKSELINRAMARAQAALDRVDVLVASGDFEGAEKVLTVGRERLGVRDDLTDGLPDEDSGELGSVRAGVAGRTAGEPTTARPEKPVVLPSDALETLRVADRRLRERAERLEPEREAWLAERAEADRRRCLRGLHAGAGLEAELAALDFGALARRLTDVRATLETEARRTQLTELASDLDSFHSALQMIAREFEAGEWRRRSLVEPGPRRGKLRQVVGATEAGWLMESDGSPELISNAALVSSTDALDGLFNARLSRDYTPAELDGIACGMRIAAVLETLDRLGPALTSSPPKLSREELPVFVELFERALEWARQAGDAPRTRLEQRVATRLLAALVDSAEGGWTSAVQELDAAVREGEGALLLLLLSSDQPD